MGLLRGPAAHQGVHHLGAGSEFGMAPTLDLVGGVELRAAVHSGERGGTAEVVGPDVEGEGGQRLELALGHRCEQGRFDTLGRHVQVVEQQGLGVAARDPGAFPG